MSAIQKFVLVPFERYDRLINKTSGQPEEKQNPLPVSFEKEKEENRQPAPPPGVPQQTKTISKWISLY